MTFREFLFAARTVGGCFGLAVILIWSARQLGYPVHWGFLGPLDILIYAAWCFHNHHRNLIALSLAQMGIEEDYVR